MLLTKINLNSDSNISIDFSKNDSIYLTNYNLGFLLLSLKRNLSKEQWETLKAEIQEI